MAAGWAVTRLAADVHQERGRKGAEISVRQAVADGVATEAFRVVLLLVGDQRLEGVGVARLGPHGERLLVAGGAAFRTGVGERLRQRRGGRGGSGGRSGRRGRGRSRRPGRRERTLALRLRLVVVVDRNLYRLL